VKPLLVLAGGYGTRLRPLVSEVPKPLAPVSGKPFLYYLIKNWALQGVKDFRFLLHYEANQIETLLNHLSFLPEFAEIQFRSVVEHKPLGTGGAILNAIESFGISEAFLIANADTWLGSGIKRLSDETSPTIAAVKVPDIKRYGSIDFEDNRVIKFLEKSEISGEGYINSGLCHLLPEIFDDFETGTYFSLEKEIFSKLTSSNQLRVIKLNESFIDIGIPEDYLRFCRWIDSGKSYDI